jgi:acyl-CoA hydrolase
VFAVDAATGDGEWVFDEPSDRVFSSPTVDNGIVYVGSTDESVYAIDADTGDEVWEFIGGFGGIGQVEASPTVHGGTVYVCSFDGVVYAIDADSGNSEWAFTDPEGSIRSSPTVVENPGSGDSVGSRVSLGTLGHHHAWAEEVMVGSTVSFAVSIDETNAPIDAGETLEVRATISNQGNTGGQQTVTLEVDGVGSDSRDVRLDPGESTTAVFTVSTDPGDDGDVPARVESEDDSDEQPAVIEPAPASAAFTVELEDASESVETGGAVEVTVAVRNVGEQSGTGTVEVDVESVGTASTEVGLDPGETTTETLTVPTSSGDGGTHAVTVATGDDDASGSVEVIEAGTDDGSEGGDGSNENGSGSDDGGEASTDGDDDGEAEQPDDGAAGADSGGDDGVIFGLSTTETAIGGAVVAGLAYVGFRAYRSDGKQGGRPPSRRGDQPPGGRGGQPPGDGQGQHDSRSRQDGREHRDRREQSETRDGRQE